MPDGLWDPRIFQFWANRLGLPADVLTRPGSYIHFAVPGRKEDRVIICRNEVTAVVIVMAQHPSLLDRAALASLQDGVITADRLIARFPEAGLKLLWRDPIYYLKPEKLPPATGPNVRWLTASDRPALAALEHACSELEVKMAEITIDDPAVAGYFMEGRLVGATSLLFMDDVIADIGVLVHPAYRKSGIASEMVRIISRWGIEHNRILQYTTTETNTGSMAVARKNGFDLFYWEEGLRVGH
ncbi:MAG TPA: GNAT family N-acetyltransferase [Aggregatilineales bacterium]|nr:GNAT family N-acetyltransferase [Aggregatilineales bacterium]